MYRWMVIEATRSRRTPPRSPAAAHYAAIIADRRQWEWWNNGESMLGDGREFRDFARIPESTTDTWWERVRRWIAG